MKTAKATAKTTSRINRGDVVVVKPLSGKLTVDAADAFLKKTGFRPLRGAERAMFRRFLAD